LYVPMFILMFVIVMINLTDPSFVVIENIIIKLIIAFIAAVFAPLTLTAFAILVIFVEIHERKK